MSKKKSIHFTDKSIEIVNQLVEIKDKKFNWVVNYLIEQEGEPQIWRALEIAKLEKDLAILKREK